MARLLLALAFFFIAQATWAAECLVVEDFAKSAVGEFPSDWKVRKEEGRPVYSIQEQSGLRFLRAQSKGLGIQAAKAYEWDVKAYPILAWAWRANEFPAGSDERQSRTNDSAVSVYAVFPYSWWSVKSLKYVWSAVVPTDIHLTSSAGLTQVRVVRTGTDKKGQWVEEQANVLEDYRRFFGEADVPKATGIAVLTDSDDTRSSAEGDYANFRVCKP